MSITVHIERLILEGLPLSGGQGMLVEAAVAAELTRLLREQGSSARLPIAHDPATSSIAVPAGAGPGQLGLQIARSVLHSIGPALSSQGQARERGLK